MMERPAGRREDGVIDGVKVIIGEWVGDGLQVPVAGMAGDGVGVWVDPIDFPGAHAQRAREATARIRTVRGLLSMVFSFTGKSRLLLYIVHPVDDKIMHEALQFCNMFTEN
jgi:hypothetical protein